MESCMRSNVLSQTPGAVEGRIADLLKKIHGLMRELRQFMPDRTPIYFGKCQACEYSFELYGECLEEVEGLAKHHVRLMPPHRVCVSILIDAHYRVVEFASRDLAEIGDCCEEDCCEECDGALL